jgi:hypothetical protein
MGDDMETRVNHKRQPDSRGSAATSAVVCFVSLTLSFASIAADDQSWADQVTPRDAGWEHVYIADGGCRGGPEWSCVCAYRVSRGNGGCVLEECETSASRTYARKERGGLGGVVGGVVGDSLCRPDDIRRSQVRFGESGVACARNLPCLQPSDAGVQGR